MNSKPIFRNKKITKAGCNPHPVFQRGFLILGHRGMPSEAPENTLSSFRMAKNKGANGIELDVRICRSGELVVMHDARINRTTDGSGFVRRLSLQDIKNYSVVMNHHLDLRDKVPALEEVFAEFAGTTIINVEIKGYPRLADRVEGKLIDLIYHFDAVEQVIVSSFNPIPLRRIRKMDPRIATGFLIDRNFFIHRTETAIQKLAGVNAIHLEASLATPRFIRRLKKMNLYCLVWGDISPQKIPALLDLKIDGVITDYPDIVKQHLPRMTH